MIALNNCNIDAIACLKVEIYSTGSTPGYPNVSGEIGFHLDGKPFGNIRIEGINDGNGEITEIANSLIDAIERCAAKTVGTIDSEVHPTVTPQGILDKDV